MKREVPLLLTALFGFFFVLDLFVSWPTWKTWGDHVKVWALIVIAFSYALGAGNILRLHGLRVLRQQKDWGYSLVTVAGMLVMVIGGVIPESWFPGAGNRSGSLHDWLYQSTYAPMSATMYGLLAFFISSAAFRAFRVRSLQAALLAITAVVVLLGRPALGRYVWAGFPDLVEWIMGDLQNAGKRAILIGAALGAISTGIKIITGTEKTFLSGD